MDGVVVEDLVVDLVGQDEQAVLPGDLQHPLQDARAVHGARGVVRVDDDHRLGARGDLGPQVLQVRFPVLRLVAEVVHRTPPGQAHGRRPQRVVRRRDEHLVAVVEQGLHRHDDEFADAVAHVDVADADVADALELAGLHDGPPRRRDALAVAVPLRDRQVGDHVLEQFVGGLETERGRVADVQLEDAVTGLLELLRASQGGAADVVEDVREFVRLLEVHDRPSRGVRGRSSLARGPRPPRSRGRRWRSGVSRGSATRRPSLLLRGGRRDRVVRCGRPWTPERALPSSPWRSSGGRRSRPSTPSPRAGVPRWPAGGRPRRRRGPRLPAPAGRNGQRDAALAHRDRRPHPGRAGPRVLRLRAIRRPQRGGRHGGPRPRRPRRRPRPAADGGDGHHDVGERRPHAGGPRGCPARGPGLLAGARPARPPLPRAPAPRPRRPARAGHRLPPGERWGWKAATAGYDLARSIGLRTLKTSDVRARSSPDG